MISIKRIVFISVVLPSIVCSKDLLNRRQNFQNIDILVENKHFIRKSKTVGYVSAHEDNTTSEPDKAMTSSQHILSITTNISDKLRAVRETPEDRALATNFVSLCANPYIYAADRLVNNTVRVYRDEFYWDLIGIPDRTVNVKGPFRIWRENMGVFDKSSSIQTVTSGKLEGYTFKYKGPKVWAWHPDGSLYSGGKNGHNWKLIPKSGFYAVYNDGDLDHKNYSRMIAFSDIHVYYYKTNGLVFLQEGESDGYEGGKNGESFPEDLTAAFAFPGENNSPNYWVYLFRRDKHCVRTYLNVSGCPEWRNNTELFGCRKKTVPSSTTTNTKPTTIIPKSAKTPESDLDSMSDSNQLNSLLMIICYIIVIIIK